MAHGARLAASRTERRNHRMTPECYQQIKQIFAAACSLPAPERQTYLDQACAGDPALRAEVDGLLAHDEKSLPLEGGISAAALLGAALGDTGATSAASSGSDATGAREQIPARIGPYRILSKIGEGGMGAVFEAEQDNPRRIIALKVIRSGIASEQVLQRFKLEAHVLGRLQHPGIAQIHEAGTAEVQTTDGLIIEQPFFSMELIRGQRLSEFVRRQHLGTRQRLELLAKVCDAVHHAHQHGVIHRDLKPGNILVDASGQPKILDFGVARVTDADVQVTTLHTAADQLIGTLAYMSPEQVAGRRDGLDGRSDVYALGVLMYELLAGHLPCDLAGKTIPEAARTIAEEDPLPLSALNRAFRGDLSTIVAKALEKDKDRRYQSAADLAGDIRRYLSDQPILAHPVTTLYQLRKFARRNPALVGGVLVAFAALLIGIVGTTSQAISATRARNRALEAERAAQQSRAEAEAQRAEAQRQAAIAQAVNDFLTDDLLAAASPEKEPERNITVRAILDRAAAAIGGRFDEQPLVEAAVRATLGDAYHALGEDQLAEPHAARALDLRTKTLDEEDPLTLGSMYRLATIYSSLARYNEAEPLLVKVLAIRRRHLGDENPATLATMNNLGLLYGRQGRDDDAEALLVQSLASARRSLGADSSAAVVAMGNLADLYTRHKRFSEAEPLYMEALEICRNERGEEFPVTLAQMSNLANLYARQGRFAEAEPLCVKTLEIRRRVLGEDHPRTLASLNSLAVLYKRQGRYAEAEPLLLQALEAKRRELGDEHPNTLVSLNNLGGLYVAQGRYAEAEELVVKLLETRRRVLGEQHPQTISTLRNLIEIYTALGRTEEAEQLRATLPAKAARPAPDDD
jgi:eukaryotic-like serine/threonine-protein kinase